MTKVEMKTLKMNILGGMHEYIKELGDEGIYETWIEVVPDEPTEDDLAFIAADSDLWRDVCLLFGGLVEMDEDWDE